jgi:DNA-binding SARP family transcriptional activator
MTVLKVRLLGKPDIQWAGHDFLALPTKVQELVFFLLLYRHYPHDRDRLAEQLWGEAEPARSRKYLRQTLWQLQTAVTQPGSQPSPLLILDKNWIHINQQTNIWLDVWELERAFTAVCDIPGQQLSQAQMENTQSAIELYQGELLTGWYHDWCIIERERFQSIYLALLEKLMDACIAHRHYENGVAYGMRVLHYDRARERTHRLLMRLYYLSGNRSAALRQFDQCTAALTEELNVAPAQRTVALRDQIRADQLITADTPALRPPNMSEPSLISTAQVVAELKELQSHLVNLQHEVKSLIQRLTISP